MRNELSSGSVPLLFMLSTSCVGFGEGIKDLGLCGDFWEANRVGVLGKEEREGGLGEEHRDRGLEEEQRARGLGVKETELCFGEAEWEECFGDMEGGKCLGEEEKGIILGDDLEGKGEDSLWECAKELLPAASFVVWITLMCCLPSSSAVLGLWRNSAVDWGRPAGWEEDWKRYEEVKGTLSPCSWLSWVEFPSAVQGLFFLLSQVFCVSRWVGGWGKQGEDSMSCQLLLREPHSGSSVNQHIHPVCHPPLRLLLTIQLTFI